MNNPIVGLPGGTLSRVAIPRALYSANWPTPRMAGVQLAAGFILIETALWTRGTIQLMASLLAASVALFCIFSYWRQHPQRTVALKSLQRGWWVAAATLVSAAVAVAIAGSAGTLHPLISHEMPGWQSLAYVPWAVLQEILLQLFFFTYCALALRNDRLAVFMTAALFALAHLPNPLLTPLTFAAGVLWMELFRRYRNVLLLGVIHAILGLTVAATFPAAVTHHMRVGMAYVHKSGRANQHARTNVVRSGAAAYGRGMTQ